MNEQLKERIITKYPEWHHNPFRLTITEIEAPYSVIGQFFECYTLPQIRACLKEMVFDAICMDDNDAPSHVTTQDDLEKLIEAAWLIHQQELKKTSSIKEDQELKQEVKAIHKEELTGDHTIIHDFFESLPLPSARGYILSTLKAAETKGVWKQSTPNDLLFFFENMESLLNAVFGIVAEHKKLQQVLLPKSTDRPDLTDYQLYCGNYDQPNPWDYVPRSLTVKEFRDPYKALKKFTTKYTKEEWKEILHYLLSTALGANSLSEFGIHLELISISEQMQKMLEACHLIYVRTALVSNKS